MSFAWCSAFVRSRVLFTVWIVRSLIAYGWVSAQASVLIASLGLLQCCILSAIVKRKKFGAVFWVSSHFFLCIFATFNCIYAFVRPLDCYCLTFVLAVLNGVFKCDPDFRSKFSTAFTHIFLLAFMTFFFIYFRFFVCDYFLLQFCSH